MEAGRGKEEEKYLRRVQERETIINSEREREGERGSVTKRDVRSMRVQGSMHMKQRMCQKSNFDSFINIILIIIASKCAINQFKIYHISWLHGRNQNSVYFVMVCLEISGISSSCKVTQHKAIK